MNIFRSIGLALVVTAGINASVWAAPSDEQQVLMLEQQWLEAVTRGDRGFVDKLLDEAFVDTTVSGKVRDKTTVLNAQPLQVGATQSLSDIDVRLHANVAVVTGINTYRADQAAAPMEVAFTDIYIKKQGHWKLISAQGTLRGK